MAFALPFVGYSVYRLLSGRMPPGSPLRAVAGGAGAYLGLNVGAALVAVLLGIQPALFHEANGHALYFPFGLNITLPAMLSTHLLVAGPVEAVVTFLVIRYMQTTGQGLYEEGREIREQGTGDREQGTGNREQGTGNRKNRREPRAGRMGRSQAGKDTSHKP